jgi:glucose-1-phosphate cytidylyltransferase
MNLKKNKQAIILAGGLSSRMGPLTRDKHKTMLKVGSYPILAHLYTQLRINNILEIFISTGYKSNVISNYCNNKIKNDSDMILNILKNKKKFKYPVISISKLKSNSSTTERVIKIKKRLNDSFFLIYADTLLKPKVKDLLNLYNKKKADIVLTISRPTPRFGTIKLKESKILNFSEKNLKNEPWVNSGWFLISKVLLKRFTSKKLNFEDYLFINCEKIKAFALKNKSFYLPIDHVHDLKKANIFWKRNKKLWL